MEIVNNVRLSFLWMLIDSHKSLTQETCFSHNFLPSFLGALVQPASLEFMTIFNYKLNLDVAVTKTLFRNQNMTLKYGFTTYDKTVEEAQLRIYNSSYRRYFWFIEHERNRNLVQFSLINLLSLYQNANVILRGPTVFFPEEGHAVFCRTIQVICSATDRVETVLLPDMEGTDDDCQTWSTFDRATVNSGFQKKLPWLRHSIPQRALRNSNISFSLTPGEVVGDRMTTLMSHYNVTLTRCVMYCDHYGVFPVELAWMIPRAHLADLENLGFLSPKGIPLSKSYYIIRPFPWDTWLCIVLCTVAFSVFFVFCRLLGFRFKKRQPSVATVVEFLVCSFFAPIRYPSSACLLGALLVAWASLVQVPFCGYRALLTSFFNNPPRHPPITGAVQLASRLMSENDPIIFCTEYWNEGEMFANSYPTLLHMTPEVVSRGDAIPPIHELYNAYEILKERWRTSECREYVRNSTGVFYGIESDLLNLVALEDANTYYEFSMLGCCGKVHIVHSAGMYYKSISKATLLASEHQIFARVERVKRFKTSVLKRTLTPQGLDQLTLQDLWPYIKIWICGMLLSCVALSFERMSSMRNVFPLRYCTEFQSLCRPQGKPRERYPSNRSRRTEKRSKKDPKETSNRAPVNVR